MYDANGNKRCSACREFKPVTEFHRNARGMPGYRPNCKICHRAKRRAHYAKNEGRDVPYEQLLKREYGMTLVDYNALLRKQAHRCAICRRPETVRMKKSGELKRLAVDHDHVTKAVRGLLCQRCNMLVWALEDNHTSLAAVAAYIGEVPRDVRQRSAALNGAMPSLWKWGSTIARQPWSP